MRFSFVTLDPNFEVWFQKLSIGVDYNLLNLKVSGGQKEKEEKPESLKGERRKAREFVVAFIILESSLIKILKVCF